MRRYNILLGHFLLPAEKMDLIIIIINQIEYECLLVILCIRESEIVALNVHNKIGYKNKIK